MAKNNDFFTFDPNAEGQGHSIEDLHRAVEEDLRCCRANFEDNRTICVPGSFEDSLSWDGRHQAVYTQFAARVLNYLRET